MGEKVAVSKAASLLGVGRKALQVLIRDGELDTFDGKVDLEQVCRFDPSLGKSHNDFTERLAMIKRSAFSRRVGGVVAPDSDELEQQLKRRTTEAGVQKARADKYEKIVDALMQELGELRGELNGKERELVDRIACWLMARVNDEVREP